MGEQQNQISCPTCGQTYAVRPEQWAQYAGQRIPCTKCGNTFTVSGGAAATAPVAPPAFAPPGAPVAVGYAAAPGAGDFAGGPPAKASRVAVASLVLGIAGMLIPWVLSIPAIVCGAIGMSKASNPRVGGRGMAIAGLVLGILGTLFGLIYIPCGISILLPSLNRAREQANRVKCASNLRQLGLAMIMYSNTQPDGAFPDTIAHLLADPSGDVVSSVFVCPSTSDTPSTATTPQKVAVDLASGGHDSYVYVGAGLINNAPPTAVLMYEPMTNHRNDGMNVLFADGHVEFVGRAKATRMIGRLQAGHNPPESGAP